jgi:hypothetical protein
MKEFKNKKNYKFLILLKYLTYCELFTIYFHFFVKINLLIKALKIYLHIYNKNIDNKLKKESKFFLIYLKKMKYAIKKKYYYY